jgi:hypothetical protein
MRLDGAPARAPDEGRVKLKNADGFDLDARVRVAADDTQGRERLLRYMTRPPLSQERLEKLSDGRYRIRLKKPWQDGTTDIVLDGVELLGRRAAWVPPRHARRDARSAPQTAQMTHSRTSNAHGLGPTPPSALRGDRLAGAVDASQGRATQRNVDRGALILPRLTLRRSPRRRARSGFDPCP